MAPEERFEFEREAFRKWLQDKDSRELELLKNDIQLREAYLKEMKEKCFFPWVN